MFSATVRSSRGVALEDHADVALGEVGALAAIHAMRSFFPEPVLAQPLVVEQSKDIEERGFARAGGSHDGEEIAFFDFEVDAAEDPGLAAPVFV